MSNAVKFWAAMALALVAILALVFGVMAWQDDQCQAKGGHFVRVDRSGVCVSPDGRLIE